MTTVAAYPRVEALSNLQERAGEVLFGDTRFRPDPRAMAALIQAGLTEETIWHAARARGHKEPVMDLTDHDLPIALPYYQLSSDTLAAEHSPAIPKVFAARDADVLFDDFVITHPDHPSALLPASQTLWESAGMQDAELAKRFLEKHRLGLAGGVIVDSGRLGSVGTWLDGLLCRLHDLPDGASLLSTGALAMRLVDAHPHSTGKKIIEIPGTVEELGLQKPLAIEPWIKGQPAAFSLFIFTQNLPRYHGHYKYLEIMGDDIVALPEPVRERRYVDGYDGINGSIVNPLAAALVQFRVVQAALERSGRTTPYRLEDYWKPQPQVEQQPTPGIRQRLAKRIGDIAFSLAEELEERRSRREIARIAARR